MHLGKIFEPLCPALVLRLTGRDRNHVPWIVISVGWAVSGLIMLLLRWYLARENARRDEEEKQLRSSAPASDADSSTEKAVEVIAGGAASEADAVYLADAHGAQVGKVDRAFLDLTDIENRQFRYAL